MKKQLMTLAVTVAIVAMASASFAGDAGDIGVFGDAAGTSSTWAATAFVPFNYYVVAFDLAGDIFGYEFAVSQDIRITVLARVPLPSNALDVGPGDDNWIVGTGTCQNGAGPVALISMQGLLFAPDLDLVVCLGPSSPSSFSPATPGYLTCVGADDLRPLGLAQSGLPDYPDGCGVGNPTGQPPVATQGTSFGALKASY